MKFFRTSLEQDLKLKDHLTFLNVDDGILRIPKFMFKVQELNLEDCSHEQNC